MKSQERASRDPERAKWEVIAAETRKAWREGWLLLMGPNQAIWAFVRKLPEEEVRHLADAFNEGPQGGAYFLVKKGPALLDAFRSIGGNLTENRMMDFVVGTLEVTGDRVVVVLGDRSKGDKVLKVLRLAET